jgi:hypothetical protein
VIAWAARKIRASSDVLIATLAVVRARRAVEKTPIGSLVQTGTEAPTEVPFENPTSFSDAERAVGWRWGAAVDRALRWTPGDSACLVRSTALRALVRSRGLPRAEVRIGVRRDGAGFRAHAWVEQDGTSIAESGAWLGNFLAFDGVTTR